MSYEHRPYTHPYRSSRRARFGAWISDRGSRLYCDFWEWFFEGIDWRRVDRFVRAALGYLLTVVALYVGFLVVYEIAVIVAITHGVWPQW